MCKSNTDRAPLIGIYYFPGWWEEQPNFWIQDEHFWLPDYPTRKPLAGLYNTQECMDAEIDSAASHGVDFFQILWYPGAEHYTHSFRNLNVGPGLFMNSKNAGRMKFALEYCNHPPYAPMDDEAWARHGRYIASCAAHPSYLRVGGKAFVKIYGAEHLIEQHGDDEVLALRRLEQLRETVLREAGLELLLCGGSVPKAPVPERIQYLLQGFDCLGTYGDVPEPDELPQRESFYPYPMLVDTAERRWESTLAASDLPYIPFLMCGWEPRPWNNERASFALPDDGELRDGLMRLRRAMEDHPRMSIPDGSVLGQKMAILYAWNEYGEGGFFAPTEGEGDRKLRILQEVFDLRPS